MAAEVQKLGVVGAGQMVFAPVSHAMLTTADGLHEIGLGHCSSSCSEGANTCENTGQLVGGAQ